MNAPLLDIHGLRHTFPKADGGDLLVLAGIELQIKGVILVTHNIGEAVLMCDLILLFSNNPGRIIREIGVDLRQPRNRLDPQFRELVEKIYVAMTARTPKAQAGARTTINTLLPRVSAHP